MAAQQWEAGRTVRGVDYYELLGVHRDATASEIKSAYRTLARTMHPDVGGTAGTFRLLQEAYETLNDPVRRAHYDGGGEQEQQPSRSQPAARRRRRNFGDDPNYVPRLPRLRLDDIAWWDGIDPDARIRYLPMTGPERAPTLALVGGWSLLLLAGLAVELTAALLAGWLALLVAAGAVILVLLRRHIRAHRADRSFAAEYDSSRIYGLRGSTDPEERAQQLTAELCAKYLTRLPGVRVFHGLAWPDSVFQDVDHAVLCGRRLVLVESKTWLPGHYTTDEEGTLWRNGHPFRGGATRLVEGVEAFEELLPGVEVRGAVLIYPSRSGEVTTVEQDEQVSPMTPGQFVREIGSWLAQDPATVDREAFTTLLDQVVTD
ncbi:Nuclease-related domain-containing protein [Saccharopolyspora kobensis]|uniref:Nuclease-related domain-containing protein n=1 Tax=Saccharopolyspora kobensis TaxID=146035 RepID=A0A1H6ASR7_9PSEU|nr:Nuclease-related domain-containing protein [Saccharopolyspora kobensis]SFE78363.1 Nuclease-related domain-containing protein [Saccharopolyspora kobensis]